MTASRPNATSSFLKARAAPARSTSRATIWSTCAWPITLGHRCCSSGTSTGGGLYASFLGTWMSFTDAERRLLTGYIVNRFRGTPPCSGPRHDYMLAHTGVPVLGTIPLHP